MWRVPSGGGAAQQITRQGGFESAESLDGAWLYYNKFGYNTVGLFRQVLPSGREELAVPLLQLTSLGGWSIDANGIYFIHRYDDIATPAKHPAIRFFDFRTRRIRDVAPLRDPGQDPGLNIVDDGRAAIFSRAASVDHDVMLIRNYH